jgi:hypothetical protein
MGMIGAAVGVVAIIYVGFVDIKVCKLSKKVKELEK